MEILKWLKNKFNNKTSKIGFTYMTPEIYYKTYIYCPRCLESEQFYFTNIRIKYIPETNFVDTKNIAHCKRCGWKGSRNELLSTEEVEIKKGELK